MDTTLRVLLSISSNHTFNEIQRGTQEGKSKISPKTLKRYIDILTKQKMVQSEKVGKRNHYKVTEKGIMYLQLEREIMQKQVAEIDEKCKLLEKLQRLFSSG